MLLACTNHHVVCLLVLLLADSTHVLWESSHGCRREAFALIKEVLHSPQRLKVKTLSLLKPFYSLQHMKQ